MVRHFVFSNFPGHLFPFGKRRLKTHITPSFGYFDSALHIGEEQSNTSVKRDEGTVQWPFVLTTKIHKNFRKIRIFLQDLK